MVWLYLKRAIPGEKANYFIQNNWAWVGMKFMGFQNKCIFSDTWTSFLLPVIHFITIKSTSQKDDTWFHWILKQLHITVRIPCLPIWWMWIQIGSNFLHGEFLSRILLLASKVRKYQSTSSIHICKAFQFMCICLKAQLPAKFKSYSFFSLSSVFNAYILFALYSLPLIRLLSGNDLLAIMHILRKSSKVSDLSRYFPVEK